jgi:hypothetical protein
LFFGRNKLALDDWRTETKGLQRQKQYQALRNGVTKGTFSSFISLLLKILLKHHFFLNRL